MDPYKRLRHTSKPQNATAGKSQFTTTVIPVRQSILHVNVCVLYLLISVHSENSSEKVKWVIAVHHSATKTQIDPVAQYVGGEGGE